MEPGSGTLFTIPCHTHRSVKSGGKVMKYGIAVLDIGKTNKKFVLFDDTLKPLEIHRRSIGTKRSPDGYDLEDVEGIEAWMLEELRKASSKVPIRGISISTHGASVVCVGKDGLPSVPPVAYTNEAPEEIHREFFRRFGSPEKLQEETATAEVRPLINVGKLLFFLSQRYPEQFSRTRHILLYPQYFAYRLTNIPAAECTYVGCHSYLWNPHKNDWSGVTDGIGIRNLLPNKVGKPAEVLGTITAEVVRKTNLDPSTIVTKGIHDSNSSMVPYLISQEEDFVLNSTGSWCVAMHETKDFSFQREELGRMIFYNLSYRASPIKTSILPGGLELDTYWNILKQIHKREDDPGWNDSLYQQVIKEKKVFVLPSVLRGAGQFPRSEPRVVEGGITYPLEALERGEALPLVFRDYPKALAAINLSVVIQSMIALQRVGLTTGVKVFIEGGFRKNSAYLFLLAALLPQNPLYLTNFEEATSVGAALCGKAAVDKVPLERLGDLIVLNKELVPSRAVPGLAEYTKKFLELTEGSGA